MRLIKPGWRYFDCPDCGCKWKETTRDYKALSSCDCINPDCPSGILKVDAVSPCDFEADLTLKTNEFGNLLEPKVVIISKGRTSGAV